MENSNSNLFICEVFLLQELKADISGSLILMFDLFFKLIETRYIMMLSECKYLI